MRQNVLYLMVVDMPSEEEMGEARREMEREKREKEKKEGHGEGGNSQDWGN